MCARVYHFYFSCVCLEIAIVISSWFDIERVLSTKAVCEAAPKHSSLSQWAAPGGNWATYEGTKRGMQVSLWATTSNPLRGPCRRLKSSREGRWHQTVDIADHKFASWLGDGVGTPMVVGFPLFPAPCPWPDQPPSANRTATQGKPRSVPRLTTKLSPWLRNLIKSLYDVLKKEVPEIG